MNPLERLTQVETPDLPRVSGQGDNRPGGVRLHVPHLDGLVVAPAHNPASVKLDAADATRVPLECSDVALAAHPGAPQLVSLHKHLTSSSCILLIIIIITCLQSSSTSVSRHLSSWALVPSALSLYSGRLIVEIELYIR